LTVHPILRSDEINSANLAQKNSQQMETHRIILIVHIICGFTALTSGIVPMVAQKGGPVHRIFGTIYARAMYGVSASALGLFLLQPERPFLQFLLCIAVLSFYFTFTGVRSIVLKRRKAKAFFADKLAAWLTLTISVLMFIYGGYALTQALMHHHDVFLPILYLIFGPALGSAARADVKAFASAKPQQKMHWFFNHFIRMLSAYIATFTAFCVVNVHFLPPILVWVLPGVIGGTMITLLVRKYKNKFNTEGATAETYQAQN
jgi:uncharacterized membrane protein